MTSIYTEVWLKKVTLEDVRLSLFQSHSEHVSWRTWLPCPICKTPVFIRRVSINQIKFTKIYLNVSNTTSSFNKYLKHVHVKHHRVFSICILDSFFFLDVDIASQILVISMSLAFILPCALLALGVCFDRTVKHYSEKKNYNFEENSLFFFKKKLR